MNGELSFDDLADEAHARSTDPQTSHDAARSVEPKMRQSQAQVWTVLSGHGPMTDAHLVEMYETYAHQYGFPRQSPSGIRTRRRELADAGKVRDTGLRSTLPSGRKAIVWEVVRDGE